MVIVVGRGHIIIAAIPQAPVDKMIPARSLDQGSDSKKCVDPENHH